MREPASFFIRGVWSILISTAVLIIFTSSASAQSSLNVAWNANTETDLAGYRLTYVPQSGGTSRTTDVGKVTTTTVTGLELGRWYNFSLVAYNTSGGVSAPSSTVSAFTTYLTGLTVSSASPILTGTTVTWTAVPAAGSPALEYEYWLWSSTGWTLARGWSSQASWSWTPTLSNVGTHYLQVWARQPGATAAYEAYRGTASFEVKAAPYSVSVTALLSDAASPFKTGQPVEWTAIVNPETLTDSLEYQFWLLNKSTNTWSIVRPYGPGNTFTITPGWTDAGNYTMRVWARYPGSNVNYGGSFDTDFRVDQGVGTFWSDHVFPVPPNTPITWTADAGSFSTPLLYQFWLSSNGTWQMVQDFSQTKTFTWTPASGDIGQHAAQVRVKTATSTAQYDAWRATPNFDVSLTAPAVAAVNLSSAPATGTATTIDAIAYGGYSGPLKYKFWLYSGATGKWTLLRDYADACTFDWTPSAPGTYGLQVWVRSAGSTTSYEAWRSLTPIVVP